jgi:hypothetical protein
MLLVVNTMAKVEIGAVAVVLRQVMRAGVIIVSIVATQPVLLWDVISASKHASCCPG